MLRFAAMKLTIAALVAGLSVAAMAEVEHHKLALTPPMGWNGFLCHPGIGDPDRSGGIAREPEIGICPPGEKVLDLLSPGQKWNYPLNRLVSQAFHGAGNLSWPADLLRL